MNIIAIIHDEIDRSASSEPSSGTGCRRAVIPSWCSQIKELDEKLDALWNEHRADARAHPLRRARADRQAGPGGRAPGARGLTEISAGVRAGLPRPRRTIETMAFDQAARADDDRGRARGSARAARRPRGSQAAAGRAGPGRAGAGARAAASTQDAGRAPRTPAATAATPCERRRRRRANQAGSRSRRARTGARVPRVAARRA